MKKRSRSLLLAVLLAVLAGLFITIFTKDLREKRILKEMIKRLEADSRIAEVLVTGVSYDEDTKKIFTTIKFLEYDTAGDPLEPKYFTFSGNIIQFQSLVVRFDDIHVRKGDRLRGRSAYLFRKVFMLDGKNTEEYEITSVDKIPEGYKVDKDIDPFEKGVWEKFWQFALDPKEAKKMGIKNAQIEAPGTMFVPGVVYKLKIEHDGGIRIDALPIPPILKGEKIPSN